MKPKVYIETSVISYLTSEPSRDVIVAGRQQITRLWWQEREAYELFASQIVSDECAHGDAEAARKRLDALSAVTLVALPDGGRRLAARLVAEGIVPRKAVEDALHIAGAIVTGMDFLVTWNCRHIANARLRRRIEAVARSEGYDCPVICTPGEVMELDP